MKTNPVRIGITSGDPNGVGPEVVLKALGDPRMYQEQVVVLYGHQKTFGFYAKLLENADIQFNLIRQASQAVAGKINLVTTWQGELNLNPGKQTDEGGKFAMQSLEAATTDVMGGSLDVLVTAPLNKENVAATVNGFTGHTGWLADKAGVAGPLMILMTDTLRVALATEHIPLSDVPAKVTTELLRNKIKSLYQSLRTDFGIRKPKIAVLGMNPHAGDNGLIGTEEAAVISPVIQRLRAEEDWLVAGPFPADGFFGSSRQAGFDGILAIYHDQGLAPFKAISFGEGVNFTAGLPFVRTSPDHGTAYDIAGKGQAGEASIRNAIYAGVDIFRRRQLEGKMNSNPLKSNPISRERS